MKKLVYLISTTLILLVLILFMPKEVFAATVTNAGELQAQLTNSIIEENKVTLTQDITISENIDVTSGEIVLDLAGNNITNQGHHYRTMFSIKGGTLTIEDSSENEEGELNTTAPLLSIITVEDEGKVIINAGKFTNIENYALTNAGGSTTINGGTFLNQQDDYAISTGGGSLTINGGTFEGAEGGALFNGPDEDEVIVNGGNFYGREGCYINAGTVIINNGTFEGTERGARVYIWPKLFINGGTFKGGQSGVSISNKDTDIKLSGGKFIATDEENFGGVNIWSAYIDTTYDPLALLEDGYIYYDNDTIDVKMNPNNMNHNYYCTQSTVEVKKLYEIEVLQGQNGTIKIDEDKAVQGQKIKVETLPETGYELDSIVVTTESGKIITVKDNTFEMVDENVKLSAKFKLIENTETEAGDEQRPDEEKDDTPKTGNSYNYKLVKIVVSSIVLLGIIYFKRKI